MEWCDEGLVIGVRTYGETSVILDLLTPERGRHLGMVLGGRSRRLRPLLQPGNSLMATWRARIDEHLGTFTVETLRMRAGQIMESAAALHALNHLCAMVRLLPERDPHPDLYRTFEDMLDRLDDRAGMPPMMVRFELLMLTELGFGLDLERCGATGTREDLAFVSPRTGRAVCRLAGTPYRDRILALPAFLMAGESDPRPESARQPVSQEDLRQGFLLTEHFLKRDVFAPRGLEMPIDRQAYLTDVLAVDWVETEEHCGRKPVRLTP